MASNEEEPLTLSEEKPLVLTNEIDKKKEDIKKNLSPAVRKIVSEKNIDVNQVKGTGKDGRIMKSDLISMMGINPDLLKEKLNMVTKKELG